MNDAKFAKIMEYMRTHWPSQVREEWLVTDEMYPKIVEQIIVDWTTDATRGKRFFRIAGQSGSGKTSQLLPAVEEWFSAREARPVLVAARRFVEYHPFMSEILTEYGEEHLREKTNEVSTILMMLALMRLIDGGYDIILDVTLLDPIVEGLLMQALAASKYDSRMTFVAVSREISDGFIAKRLEAGGGAEGKRRVAKTTASEFWRATNEALKFYGENYPEMPVLVWNVWDSEPVFDGGIGDKKFLPIVQKYWEIKKTPIKTDEVKLRESKFAYLESWE